MSTDDTNAARRGSGSNDLLGLVNAASVYAANFDGDPRQDIKFDVMNAFAAGAKFGRAAERERLASAIRAEASRTSALGCKDFAGESPSFWVGMEHAASVVEKA